MNSTSTMWDFCHVRTRLNELSNLQQTWKAQFSPLCARPENTKAKNSSPSLLSLFHKIVLFPVSRSTTKPRSMSQSHYKKHEGLLRQALPVSTDVEIDESRPPATAEEYLARVRLEAQSIPHVMTASTTFSPPNTKHKKPLPNSPNVWASYLQVTACDNALLPSKDWQKQFSSTFSEMRNIISEMPVSKLNRTDIQIPSSHGHRQWLHFMLNVPLPSNSNSNSSQFCLFFSFF